VTPLTFTQPHRVSDPDRQLLELHARHAADPITRLRYEEELRQAERRKDEFLATLADELRGPLALLVNTLHVLKLAADQRSEKQIAARVLAYVRSNPSAVDNVWGIRQFWLGTRTWSLRSSSGRYRAWLTTG
jgi:signal transduction histidine kinase